MEPTLEVRVRHEDEVRARVGALCKIVPGEEEETIQRLRQWGVYCDGTTYSGLGAEFSGQYVIDELGGYFEVVIHASDA